MIAKLIHQEEGQLAYLRQCLPTADAHKLPFATSLRRRIADQEARLRALRAGALLAHRT
jgi:hypothetical protein